MNPNVLVISLMKEMCIRDRPAAERQYDPRKPDAGRLTVIAKELTEIVHELDTSRPVSYTHLDVYKRQRHSLQLSITIIANMRKC